MLIALIFQSCVCFHFININGRESVFIKPSEDVDQVQENSDVILMIYRISVYGIISSSRNYSWYHHAKSVIYTSV